MRVERNQEDVAGEVQALVRLVLHETRTPLNAICGFADLLLAGAGGPLGAGCVDYVGQVATAARALERELGHLQELAAAHALAAPPAAPVDLAAGLAAAGFRVVGGDDPARPTGWGDPSAWRRAAELARTYLEDGRDVPSELRATFGRVPGGRVEVLLEASPGRVGHGTGLLALELARRLAGRVGGELRPAAEGSTIVVAWPAENPQTKRSPGGKMAAAGPRA